MTLGTTVITEGKLKTSGQTFEVRGLNIGHVQEILELQQDVKRMVENTSALQTLSKEEFEYIFSDKGFVVGAFVNNQMIAFRAMLEPPIDDPEHLGIDTGLATSDLHKVIYSEITVVHPSYRGNGLQTYMGEIVMNMVDKECFPYVAATVAPFNIPSLKDKLALGMEIIALKEKYNRMLRYIFFKDLTNGSKGSISDMKKLDMGATQNQQKLLNEGYRGIAINRAEDSYEVTFQKKIL